jgi:hypothetical protein
VPFVLYAAQQTRGAMGVLVRDESGWRFGVNVGVS